MEQCSRGEVSKTADRWLAKALCSVSAGAVSAAEAACAGGAAAAAGLPAAAGETFFRIRMRKKIPIDQAGD